MSPSGPSKGVEAMRRGKADLGEKTADVLIPVTSALRRRRKNPDLPKPWNSIKSRDRLRIDPRHDCRKGELRSWRTYRVSTPAREPVS